MAPTYWRDNTKVYSGTVKEDAQGLYITVPGGKAYLKDSQRVSLGARMPQIKSKSKGATKTHYRCPDCGHEQNTGAKRVKCSHCGSLNLQREVSSGKYIKADMSEKPQVKYLFDRNGTPYYGIWDPVKDKYLHEDGSWTDPYPEKGLMYYANNPDIAGLKLRTVESKSGQQVKPMMHSYVVELYSSKDDGIYEAEVKASSLADAEQKGREILLKKYPRHGSDIVAHKKQV